MSQVEEMTSDCTCAMRRRQTSAQRSAFHRVRFDAGQDTQNKLCDTDDCQHRHCQKCGACRRVKNHTFLMSTRHQWWQTLHESADVFDHSGFGSMDWVASTQHLKVTLVISWLVGPTKNILPTGTAMRSETVPMVFSTTNANGPLLVYTWFSRVHRQKALRAPDSIQ